MEDVQNEVADQIKTYLDSGALIVRLSEEKKKIPVTVYAESTPNPSVLKFVANKKITTTTHEFTSIDDTKYAPMAAELFHFPFVKSVFIDENFVSITKFDIAEWSEVTMELREFIRSYIENGKTIIDPKAPETISKQSTQLDNDYESRDDISKEIINILEEYVKPAVASDGGNIEFQSYDPIEKKVKVLLQGACSGCPSSTFTLKSGIENMLKEMMKDKVEIVEAING
jgi:Fe-S cluster biogenesis protein NfuA